MLSYCSAIVILMMAVGDNDGGCHVHNWPHSCQANFRIGPQRCEPCESGSYGCNCSEQCPNDTYGQGCYHVCDCSDEQFCDTVVGCTNKYTTTDITTGVKHKVESTPRVEGNTKDLTSTPSLMSETDQLSILTVVGITTGALLSIGVVSNVVCFLFLCRRKSGSIVLEKVNQDLKSAEGELELGTSDENIDVHSYLTISDRSVRLYTGVHYDEAEDKKSSPSLSLHSEKEDPRIESNTLSSPSLSLHSKKEEDASTKSDTSKISHGYLTPVVTTGEETKSGSQRSSDYEEFAIEEINKCTENSTKSIRNSSPVHCSQMQNLNLDLKLL